MAVYIDAPVWKRRNSANPKSSYAHMVADSLEELHSFAELIGVSQCWFDSGNKPHYDIPEKYYAKALEHGALLARPREILTKSLELLTNFPEYKLGFSDYPNFNQPKKYRANQIYRYRQGFEDARFVNIASGN